jgi:hypothetical protein
MLDQKLTGAQKILSAFLVVLAVSFMGGGLFYFFPTVSNQGYAPEQPIPFSHRQHAGDLNIDCRYCHTGVTKSPHAGIPPISTCINCHMVVATDSPHIQKMTELYHAGEAIEWIRVYELPDHARFNHARHFDRGVSCETCHGDVRSMDVIVQATPLTMGWCLSCHTGRDVPTKVLSSIKATARPDAIEPKEGEGVAPFNCATCHY